MASKSRMNFKSMLAADVPRGRNGKHKGIVTKILADLDRIPPGAALKVPLDNLTEGKAKVRSALNRASRKRDKGVVATASDDKYLYIWNEKTGKG